MVDFEYLGSGLRGLARAHRAGALAGHLGAAAVAGYFFGEAQPDLDRMVFAGIEQDLDRVIRGEESIWFDAKKTGIPVPTLFEPLPAETPRTELTPNIAKALARNIDKTRQSGHNVIFASLAIRALHDHPEFATPAVVEGIGKLIRLFDGAVPGRGYYGKQRGWIRGDQVTLPADDGFPLYDTPQGMARVVVDELIRSASLRRQGFGGLFHIINHAAGLIELSRFGHQDLAQRGLAAHYHHVRLWKSLPDVEQELGPLKRAAHDPRTPAYWSQAQKSQWSAHLTHRIKTLYGFFTVLEFIEDAETRRKAETGFLYLMA